MTQRDQADVHADVIVIGGGVSGLSAGMLLARDGRRVRVLERDPAPPPAPPAASWHAWERRGVNQFHMLHSFLARWRQTIEAELPEVAAAMDAAGALRLNAVADAPAALSGGPWPGDERFEVLTARRPVTEAVMASVAAATPGLVVERGTGVRGLTADDGRQPVPGRPHVTGVVTEDGRRLTADLVVDAGGRRSPRPRWLAGIGAPPGVEHVADSGFVYYCRHFRSADGSVPPAFGPPLQPYGSVSILALPSDNGTWGVGIVASGGDRALRALRDEDTWTRVVKHYPLFAHWLDGEPISDVDVIAKIEDRQRHDWHDGAPCATGIVAIADAWAATNPSVGRGASIGVMHAVALRDVLRATPPGGDPVALGPGLRRRHQRDGRGLRPRHPRVRPPPAGRDRRRRSWASPTRPTTRAGTASRRCASAPCRTRCCCGPTARSGWCSPASTRCGTSRGWPSGPPASATPGRRPAPTARSWSLSSPADEEGRSPCA